MSKVLVVASGKGATVMLALLGAPPGHVAEVDDDYTGLSLCANCGGRRMVVDR